MEIRKHSRLVAANPTDTLLSDAGERTGNLLGPLRPFLLAAGLLCGACLLSCQSPEAVRHGDRLAARSEEAYARGVESLVRAIAESLRKARRQHALDLFDLAWGEKVGADGKIASEDAKRLSADLEARYGEADDDYARVMTALAKARLNLQDARDLRAALTDYLGAAGVQKSTVDAVLEEVGRRVGSADIFRAPEVSGASTGGGGE